MATASEAPASAVPHGGAAERMPRAGRIIRFLAAVNVATVAASLVSYSLGWQYGMLLFPQASVFFPAAWTGPVVSGVLWFVAVAIAAATAAFGALRSPAGHRGYGAFRAITICGAVVAGIILVLVLGSSFVVL
ncbi:hypothetical protein [Microbacterium sp. LKL04]|uniref:hypothetical protein n=1 Tax=Microbacterium sp. LKL04 TaxID=912630 RepID=UPI000B8520F7|nr:hypothetical protein [Microbacterium sp. LKL04]